MKVKIPSTKNTVQRIVFAYAFFSSLWILLSDQFIARLAISPLTLAHINTLKGWAFVLVTSGLLYVLLRQYWRSLRDSHYLLQSIVEGTTDAIFVKDLQGRYVMVNSACTRVLSRSVEDVLGKDDTELFSPETGRQVMANDRRVMETGESRCLEETGSINGSTRTYLSVKTPYCNHRGEVAGLIGIARDISDRKQMELALRETTQTLEALVQASPLAIALLTPEGSVKLWNPAAERIFGWSASEALGQPIPIVPLDQQEEFAALRQRVLSGESFTGVELQRMRHDGSLMDISLSTAPLVDEQGQVYAIMSIFADITLQKQAAAEIQRLNAELEQRAIESETRYQQIVELAEEGIWVLDRDRKTLYVNQAMTRILGYSELQMQGRPLTDFVQFTAEHEILFDCSTAQRSEVRLLAKTGEERWVYFSTSPATAPDGSLLWCCALVYDITARKRSEQALRESEERFRLLLEQVKDYAIFLLDAEGKVASWNLGSERIKGYQASEIIGQNFSCFYPREDVQQGKPARELAIATAEGQFEDEGWRIRKDGSRFWADVVLTALRDETGQLRGFSKVTRDITQRKQAQEQLQQSSERISLANAELARATRLKDEFLANMSHELRTPLNAVLGLSEALLEEVYGTLTDKQRKSLVTIEQSGKHLLELINDILDLSKIESGKMELQVELTNLTQVCDSSLTFIKQLAHKKQIKIGSRISPDLGEIKIDKRRIHQVLINLLSNAVKFTPERGEVWIEAWGDTVNETIHLCVIDTGIGIAPENSSKLFQPFVQLDNSLSRRHAGTGLGLALVRRIVELHGGSVSLESEVGKGSRFTITLPWKTGSQPINVNQERPTLPSIPDVVPTLQRALIIEDTNPAAKQIARYLSELGAEAMIHPQGEGALEQAVQFNPDVMFLDLLLPHLSGWDVLMQVKADPRTCHIPIVIISIVDEQARALELGAAEYLVKPISRQQLHAALRKILLQETRSPKGHRQSQSPQQTTFPLAPLTTPRSLILLAEDNEANIATLIDYLEIQGYQMILARNGLEAVQVAKQQKPDLILMDIQMPEMDGLEATRRIRADQETADIPIIALTSLVMPGDREKCLIAGANEYLPKPISLKKLLNAIAILLG